MECAAEPDQRVARLAHCRDGHAFAGVTIVAQPMTARPEPSCAILRCEGRQRPHDIDLKLLAALDRRPKIMVTVGILGERVGVYLDGLGESERDEIGRESCRVRVCQYE